MKYPPKTVVVAWMNTIWKTDLPSNSKLIACYLRSYMNDKKDIAWPSYATITGETGLSKATVAKYLNVLDEEGWIARNRGHQGKNTEYIATIPEVFYSIS